MKCNVDLTSDIKKYCGKIMSPVFFAIFQISCKLLNFKAIFTSTEKVKMFYKFRWLRVLATQLQLTLLGN